MTDTLDDDLPLYEHREWLREHLDDGAKCPCCTQFAKVYRRKINSGMARALIDQYRTVGQDWANTARLVPEYREGAKLAWWGLMEEERDRREDGGRSGYWRVTDLGKRFVRNEVRVPKYARVYDGRLLGLDRYETTSIIEALGTRFDYADLMRGI